MDGTMGWMVPAAAIVGCRTSAVAVAALVRQGICTVLARSSATLLLAGTEDADLSRAVAEVRRSPGDRVAFERLGVEVRRVVAAMPAGRRRWVEAALDGDGMAERRRYVMRVTGGVMPPTPAPVPLHPHSTAA